ncbi:hypothetical protein [Paenibacillus sp. sgz302251]|uniref:hypothetical protein n=1 Tax=Paenibacillus sp. sgz302251 TaxID=3414493 RepID=UPI003C79C756
MHYTRWKLYQRVICWVLILSLSIPALPGSNLAKTHAQTASKEKIDERVIAPQAGEVVELRTEKSKTQRNSNGSYTTEISSIPIHYQDATSKRWKAISNRIEQNPTSFYNNDHSFKVRFNKTFERTADLLKITDNKQSIALTPVSETAGSVQPTRNQLPGYMADNTITYKNLYPGADLQYTLGNDKIKEDIVLHKKPDTQTKTIYSNQNHILIQIETSQPETGILVGWIHLAFRHGVERTGVLSSKTGDVRFI